MIARSLFTLLLLLLTAHLYSQQYFFQHYTTKDGLTSNNVAAVIRDSKGILWTGNQYGINWYDGSHFSSGNIPAPIEQKNVIGFAEDKQHNIWINTFFGGLLEFKNGKFYQYWVDSTKKEFNSNTTFRIIQLDSSSYIVATDYNLYLFSNEKFSPFDYKNELLKCQITGLTKISDTDIIAASSHGIFWYKKKNNSWMLANHLLKEVNVNGITSIQNKVYAATLNGLAEIKISKNNFSIKWSLQGIALLHVNNDFTGNIWAIGKDVYKIKNDSIVVFSNKNGMIANIIYAVYKDQELNTWFATDKGLMKLKEEYSQYTNIAENMGLMISMGKDKSNNLWIGTFNGLIKLQNGKIDKFTSINNRVIGYVYKIITDQNKDIYALTDGGIIRINNALKLISNISCASAYADSDGIYFGRKDGNVTFYQGGIFKKLFKPDTVNDILSTIYKRNEFLYIGYYNSGIKKYRLDTDTLKLVPSQIDEKNIPLKIRSFVSDNKGNLYFGTRNKGIYIYDQYFNKLLGNITNSTGLGGNWVKGLLYEGKGNIIAATDNGANRINTIDFINPTITNMFSGSQIFPSEISVVYKDEDQFIFAHTELTFFKPVLDIPSSFKPLVYVTHFSVPDLCDSTIVPGTANESSLILSHDHNNISFDYTCIFLKDESAIKYSYLLEGANGKWSEKTSKRSISFANLQPGKYIFKVAAYDPLGKMFPQIASFSFNILTPFYKAWWFYILCFIIAIVLFYAAFKYRIRQILKLENIRIRISSDLHDDIGSTLSSISILSDLVIHRKDDIDVNKVLHEVKNSSVSILEKMDDIIWTINPKKDSLEDLISRIKKFASSLFEARDIEYTFSVPDNLKGLKLSMDYRREIYLIMKEGINNMVKYSQATKAFIAMSFENGILSILIKDNGIGFIKENVEGNGLINMKQRAKNLHAELHINSEINKGVIISLFVKIR